MCHTSSKVFVAVLIVTEFAKRGLPHTSSFWLWKTITWCSIKVQVWNFHQFLHYASGLNCTISRSIAFKHLKLWIMEACKSDVCGRPLFANPVTIAAWNNFVALLKHVIAMVLKCTAHLKTIFKMRMRYYVFLSDDSLLMWFNKNASTLIKVFIVFN